MSSSANPNFDRLNSFFLLLKRGYSWGNNGKKLLFQFKYSIRSLSSCSAYFFRAHSLGTILIQWYYIRWMQTRSIALYKRGNNVRKVQFQGTVYMHETAATLIALFQLLRLLKRLFFLWYSALWSPSRFSLYIQTYTCQYGTSLLDFKLKLLYTLSFHLHN